MYDGSHKINVLCAVNIDNDDKLPDMKIKDETLKYLSLQSSLNNKNKSKNFFLGVGFHKGSIHNLRILEIDGASKSNRFFSYKGILIEDIITFIE